MASTPVTSATEPAYGAKVQQANNEQMQQAATAVAASQYPQMFAEGDEDSQSGNTVTQSGNVNQPMVSINNPYMMLPAQLNFPQLRQKTPVERRYDAGSLWGVLAGSPDASEVTRMVARGLMNNE